MEPQETQNQPVPQESSSPTSQLVQPSVEVTAPPKPKRKKEVTIKKKKSGDVLVKQSKLDLFLIEYEKNGGNGTEAAMKVFNPKNRVSAANIASIYLKRSEALGRAIMEKKGYTYEKLVDSAWAKNQTAKTPEWWDRLMKLGGYEDFMTKQGATKATISVMSIQKGLLDEYVDGEIIADGETTEEDNEL